MNYKLVWLSAIVTASIGVVIGLTINEITAKKYESQLHQNLHDRSVLICGTVGLIVGTAQESIVQLKDKKIEKRKIHNFT